MAELIHTKKNCTGDVELLEAAGVPEHTVEIELPFIGFYESVHDATIDLAFESYFENDSGEMLEGYNDSIWSADVDWSAIHREYCEQYVDGFADATEIWMQFADMSSPREYNFTTDRIFANADAERMDEIRTKVEAYPEWPGVIRERFTDRDGFWSNYSSDSTDEQWTRAELDACQWRVILEEWLEHEHKADPLNVQEWNEREYEIASDIEVAQFESFDKALDVIEEYHKRTNQEGAAA